MATTNTAALPEPSAKKRRRSVRRGIEIACEVRSDLWDGAIRLSASNLSPEGMWLDTKLPLDEGDELLVSFSPPGQFLRLHALCEVRRVGLWRRASDPWPSGMGVAFTDLTPADQARLARSLIGIPPPLPRGGVHRRDEVGEGEVDPLPWSALSEPLTGGLPHGGRFWA